MSGLAMSGPGNCSVLFPTATKTNATAAPLRIILDRVNRFLDYLPSGLTAERCQARMSGLDLVAEASALLRVQRIEFDVSHDIPPRPVCAVYKQRESEQIPRTLRIP
jgi:hypothetical protein